MGNDINALTEAVNRFTEERDWDQFHNPKDLAIAISLEASELLEAFLWKKPEEAKVEKVKEELADVINYSQEIQRALVISTRNGKIHNCRPFHT